MNKPFAWSFSKLKNYETCPRRHYEVDIAKNFKDDDSEALLWGNEVHKAAADYLSGSNRDLPEGMPTLNSWLEKLKEVPYDKILVEKGLAISRDFSPVEYFGRLVWFRAKVDFLGIKEPVGIAIDWKTGKLVDESVQLALMAQCIFSHYPLIQKLRTEFVWLKEGPGVSTRQDFTRGDMPSMWQGLWPRVEQLEAAHNSKSYPPKPGPLCARWCPVTSCEYNGRN